MIGDLSDPLGHATLRDQKPLTLSKLERLVEGITPEGYIRLINDRVYFYMKPADVERVRAQREDGGPQLLLTFDSRRLLADYSGSVRVAKINTGATIGMQGRRGPRTWLAHRQVPRPGDRGQGVHRPRRHLRRDALPGLRRAVGEGRGHPDALPEPADA